jgi:hypothetical protein
MQPPNAQVLAPTTCPARDMRLPNRPRLTTWNGKMEDGSDKNAANAQPAMISRQDDAKKAMAEYEAAAIATRAKTERLRALRLAREAASPQPAPAKKRKAAAKKGKSGDAASGSLADWLDEEAKQGRRG